MRRYATLECVSVCVYMFALGKFSRMDCVGTTRARLCIYRCMYTRSDAFCPREQFFGAMQFLCFSSKGYIARVKYECTHVCAPAIRRWQFFIARLLVVICTFFFFLLGYRVFLYLYI